jgi:hypothetical protein
MVFVDLVGPYKIRTPAKTLSSYTHNDRSNITKQVVLKLLKPQISQHPPSRIYFITPGWHVTHDLNLLSLTMVGTANSDMSSNNRVTIMALKSN